MYIYTYIQLYILHVYKYSCVVGKALNTIAFQTHTSISYTLYIIYTIHMNRNSIQDEAFNTIKNNVGNGGWVRAYESITISLVCKNGLLAIICMGTIYKYVYNTMAASIYDTLPMGIFIEVQL